MQDYVKKEKNKIKTFQILKTKQKQTILISEIKKKGRKNLPDDGFF